MNRRSFLTLLGLAPLAPAAAAQVVASAKAPLLHPLTPALALEATDWRYCVRIANIDVSTLAAVAPQSDLVELMNRAMQGLPKEPGRSAICLNRSAYAALQRERRWGWLTRWFRREVA